MFNICAWILNILFNLKFHFQLWKFQVSNGLAVKEDRSQSPNSDPWVGSPTKEGRGGSPSKEVRGRSPPKEVRGRSPQKEIISSSISPSKSDSSIVSSPLLFLFYNLKLIFAIILLRWRICRLFIYFQKKYFSKYFGKFWRKKHDTLQKHYHTKTLHRLYLLQDYCLFLFVSQMITSISRMSN